MQSSARSRRRDRGAAASEYAALVLLGSFVLLALFHPVARVAGEGIQRGVCRLFGGDCEPAARPAGEDPPVTSRVPAEGQAPARRNSLAGCRPGAAPPDVPGWEGCGPPPGTIPEGPPREDLVEAGERAGRAIGEFLGWWPYMLHPDDLLRFVYGHDSVWTDFEDVMGYTPVRVQTPDGPRMINPEGSCSTPSLPVIGQAPPGDTGRSFDFTNACLAHDYAYDLMRFYDELGIPHDPEARRAADTLFESDLHAHCATRSGFDREACDSWATTYAAAVFLNSDRQGFGVP